ncbi:hypothetical protein A6R68_13491 [Neotoma lepida]|uniref:Uncharacterized protein n=1 Tax=Neotoma lepida TaxID=56216 RepID=A0A1A6H2U9_NEOLE|nr:hypothetical protein A6R68_13491 [Neotoma lepida]
MSAKFQKPFALLVWSTGIGRLLKEQQTKESISDDCPVYNHMCRNSEGTSGGQTPQLPIRASSELFRLVLKKSNLKVAEVFSQF